MQFVSFGDNLHEMAKPIFLEKYENIFQHVVCCFVFYPACQALMYWSSMFLKHLNVRNSRFYNGISRKVINIEIVIVHSMETKMCHMNVV